MPKATERLDSINAGVHTVIMATDTFSMLRARRKEIAAELEVLGEKASILRAEDLELESAERVLMRFGPLPDEVDAPAQDDGGKPAGTPTTPNMILALLREAHAQGKAGLEPREMQITISKRWWPSVKSEDVGPAAWRMWRAGRLAKEGSLYMLPEKQAQVGWSTTFTPIEMPKGEMDDD